MNGTINKTWQHKNIAGFTLVEALIAIVLIIIGIGGALGAISAGLRAHTAGAFYSTAATLAQQKMAEIEAAPKLSAGSQEGDFLPDYPAYRWESAIQEGPEGLWEVTVQIAEVTQKKRHAQITTYLLRRNE